jgi:hypothetical protein
VRKEVYSEKWRSQPGQGEGRTGTLSSDRVKPAAAAGPTAEALIEARTRELSERLEGTQRQADELRARAEERLQAIERLETSLREPSELLQTRLTELSEELRQLTSFMRGVFEVSRQDVLRSTAHLRVKERELAESLRPSRLE